MGGSSGVLQSSFESLAAAVRASTEATVLFIGVVTCFFGVFLILGRGRLADTGTGILDSFPASLDLNDLVTKFGVAGGSAHAGFSQGTV